MNHQRCFTIWLSSAAPATHVAKWPGARSEDIEALLATITRFFLEELSKAPFVSGPPAESAAEDQLSKEVLDAYAEKFKDPVRAWAAPLSDDKVENSWEEDLP